MRYYLPSLKFLEADRPHIIINFRFVLLRQLIWHGRYSTRSRDHRQTDNRSGKVYPPSPGLARSFPGQVVFPRAIGNPHPYGDSDLDHGQTHSNDPPIIGFTGSNFTMWTRKPVMIWNSDLGIEFVLPRPTSFPPTVTGSIRLSAIATAKNVVRRALQLGYVFAGLVGWASVGARCPYCQEVYITIVSTGSPSRVTFFRPPPVLDRFGPSILKMTSSKLNRFVSNWGLSYPFLVKL